MRSRRRQHTSACRYEGIRSRGLPSQGLPPKFATSCIPSLHALSVQALTRCLRFLAREEERLAVLSLYGLDKINKFPLDTLTKLAKNVFQCDSIVVDVVTEDKVHFVASSGWSETELNDDEESPEVDFEIG